MNAINNKKINKKKMHIIIIFIIIKYSFFFQCKNSIKCKGQYTYEEISNNHSHENSQIIKCYNCANNLNNTPNFLKFCAYS